MLKNGNGKPITIFFEEIEMKKTSKAIRKDYSKLEDCVDKREYYGLFFKANRVKLDTKRYKKYFNLPNKKIEQRKTVYYTPTRIHRYDYMCNEFRDTLSDLKQLWINEFSKAIHIIKTPKQVEDDARTNNLMDGILDYDEASMSGVFASLKREKPYKFVIKSIYAQFFQQMMAQIDALSLRVIVSQGYKNDDFSKKLFDTFIQGKQTCKDKVDFFGYTHYAIYDRAYLVWNFLKHNSLRSYEELKRKYPEMIYDPNSKYENGDLSLSVLKIDEAFILNCLDNLHEFFDEVCVRGFGENPDDAQWDYDDYFIKQVDYEIESITNPLGLPPWV